MKWKVGILILICLLLFSCGGNSKPKKPKDTGGGHYNSQSVDDLIGDILGT